MMYIKSYKSPLGVIYMRSDGDYLTGLWFKGSKDMDKHQGNFIEADLPIFNETKKWLDIYFSGKDPNFTPKYKIENLTFFRMQVTKIMNKIPYGQVVTYKDIALEIAKEKGIKKMSAQAVGGAVGANPICIIIPCHRVVGTNGSLTGYGGGLQNKIKLLELEGLNINKFSIPKHFDKHVIRCKWCNLKNPNYVNYHDNEWGRLNKNDNYLFEMLILESFQAGLSWECVLNKRKAFEKAYDNFDLDKVCVYDNNKINELYQNKDIIRNKLKIKASISNAQIFKKIKNEYGTFYNYLNSFSKGKIIYENNKTRNNLSDDISKDLQKRGMKFVGSTIIYAYLQAIGFIYSHDKNCYLAKENV